MQHTQLCGMLAKGCESVSTLRTQIRVTQGWPIRPKLSGNDKNIHPQSLHKQDAVGMSCVIVSAPRVPSMQATL